MAQWSLIREADGYGITGERLRFWESRKRFQTVAAGRRSLKSILSRRKLILELPKKKEWEDPRYIYAAPTYGHVKRLGWDFFKAHIPKRWIASVSESDLMIRTVFNSELWLVGLDKPQRVEGAPLDGILIDERADVKAGAWAANIRPALSDRTGFAWQIGVPDMNGVSNIEYKELFELGLSGTDADYDSFTWLSSDVLPAEEVEAARRSLPPNIFRQEYEASFEDAPDRAYNEFSRAKHVQREVPFVPELPVRIGCDFNRGHHNWGLYQVTRDGHYRIFDEIYLYNASVQDMCNELRRRLERLEGVRKEDAFSKQIPLDRLGQMEMFFYGDYSGTQMRSEATYSAWQQIKNVFKPDGAQFFYQKQPPIVDRINAVNGVMVNAAGEVRCQVAEQCRNHIRDFEQVTRKMLYSDQKTGELTHASDAFGYTVFEIERQVKYTRDYNRSIRS